MAVGVVSYADDLANAVVDAYSAELKKLDDTVPTPNLNTPGWYTDRLAKIMTGPVDLMTFW